MNYDSHDEIQNFKGCQNCNSVAGRRHLSRTLLCGNLLRLQVQAGFCKDEAGIPDEPVSAELCGCIQPEELFQFRIKQCGCCGIRCSPDRDLLLLRRLHDHEKEQQILQLHLLFLPDGHSDSVPDHYVPSVSGAVQSPCPEHPVRRHLRRARRVHGILHFPVCRIHQERAGCTGGGGGN